MAASVSDNLASKPGVVGSSPAGRAGFPLRRGGAAGAIRSDSESQSPDSVPVEASSRKTNTSSATRPFSNAEMVARLLAARGSRELTDADVLAQVRAARKSVAVDAPPRLRPQWVRCECGSYRLASLRVHSPQNRNGKRVDCMGREVSP